MNNRYMIEPRKLIEQGVETIVFDPNKVIVFQTSMDARGNEGVSYIGFKYMDAKVELLMRDLGYSHDLNDSDLRKGRSFDHNKREDVDSIFFSRTVKAKLRYKKLSRDHTTKSLKEYEEKSKAFFDKYNLEYAKQQFKIAVEHFSQWYVDRQLEKTVIEFSNVSAWDFNTVKEIQDMDEEIKELNAKLQALKKKRFDKKCDLAVKHIEDNNGEVHGDFKKPLVQAIELNRLKGEKRDLFA